MDCDDIYDLRYPHGAGRHELKDYEFKSILTENVLLTMLEDAYTEIMRMSCQRKIGR